MNHPESKLQRDCVKWFRYQYPKYMIHANANGGYRSALEAAIMNGEGVTAGVPDLTVIIPGEVFYIEMKAPNGKVSPLQRQWIENAGALGVRCYVCRSIDEFIAIITDRAGMSPKAIETFTKHA